MSIISYQNADKAMLEILSKLFDEELRLESTRHSDTTIRTKIHADTHAIELTHYNLCGELNPDYINLRDTIKDNIEGLITFPSESLQPDHSDEYDIELTLYFHDDDTDIAQAFFMTLCGIHNKHFILHNEFSLATTHASEITASQFTLKGPATLINKYFDFMASKDFEDALFKETNAIYPEISHEYMHKPLQ